MRIILCGYGGHMGREVRTCAERLEDACIVAGVDPMAPAEGVCVPVFAECAAEADVIIDFSHQSMTGALLDFAEAKKLPVVLATTGQTEEEKARIQEAAKNIAAQFRSGALPLKLAQDRLDIVYDLDGAVQAAAVIRAEKADAATVILKLGDREVTSAEMVKKGDVLTFGTYEQDGNTDNGREPLKWRVLRKDDTKLLLITDQVIDSMAFTTVKNAERWKNSSLRAWLNDAFYDRTFSSLEKKLILEQKVEDAGNSFHGVPEGDTTWDRVFLLDITDTANLFASDEERIAVPTQYALLQGALTEKGFCGWWLRNPGMHTSLAAFVAADGSVYRAGDSVGRDDVGVRPVIWIEIPAA